MKMKKPSFISTEEWNLIASDYHFATMTADRAEKMTAIKKKIEEIREATDVNDPAFYYIDSMYASLLAWRDSYEELESSTYDLMAICDEYISSMED